MGVFQNRGVCGQAFLPFPSPTPFLPHFCSRLIYAKKLFCAARISFEWYGNACCRLFKTVTEVLKMLSHAKGRGQHFPRSYRSYCFSPFSCPNLELWYYQFSMLGNVLGDSLDSSNFERLIHDFKIHHSQSVLDLFHLLWSFFLFWLVFLSI